MRVRKASLLLLLFLLILQGCGKKPTPTTAPPPPDPPTVTPPVVEAPPPEKPEPEPAVEPEPELIGALGVMVENSPGARPQAGLNQADIVYELETEYGITRFLSFYHTKHAAKIGPVRSARMGFYEIAKAYGLPYGHAGGNPDVLSTLALERIIPDLDEIYTCGGCFWRSDDRVPPHNLYTSTELVTANAAERGIQPLPLHRFPSGAITGGRPATQVRYSWGPETQDVAWEWDGKRYVRFQSGAPHMLEDGSAVTTDNLVLFWTRYVWVFKGEWQHDVSIQGSGEGYLFRNGLVYPITWEKAGATEHYIFTLEDGSPALLSPGQSWVAVIKSENGLAFAE